MSAPNTLKMRRRLSFAVVGVLAAGMLWDACPLPDASQRLQQIPRHGPGLVGRDLPLTADELAILQGANWVHRLYLVDGRQIYLTVIDGAGNRHAVHDPRYCLRGAGWELAGQRQVPITGGLATWLGGQRGAERLEAVYWFSDCVGRHASFTRYRWQTAWRRFTLGRSGAEPVLVVIQAFDPPPDWPALVNQLIATLEL